ncbi:MAG: alpha-E domain-containing protein [bacterium]
MTDRTLSSTALRTYWLGRYLERAGSTARLVSVNANLMIDLPALLPLGWMPLVEILSQEKQYLALYGNRAGSSKKITDQNERDSNEKSVARFLLSDQRNPGSLLNALAYARENARTLRGSFPRGAYQHINETYLSAKELLQEPLSRSRRNTGLQEIIGHLDLINGFLSSTMLHNASWQFYRLGNFIERADMTTRLIDLRTTNLVESGSDLEPFTIIQWRSVLNSLDSMQNYTISMQNPVNQEDVLEFLLKNDDLPRSLMRCLNTVRNCLRQLPNNAEPLELVNNMRRQLQRARVRTLKDDRLHKYVDARQKQLFTLHNKITSQYFPKS